MHEVPCAHTRSLIFFPIDLHVHFVPKQYYFYYCSSVVCLYIWNAITLALFLLACLFFVCFGVFLVLVLVFVLRLFVLTRICYGTRTFKWDSCSSGINTNNWQMGPDIVKKHSQRNYQLSDKAASRVEGLYLYLSAIYPTQD